MSPARWPSTTCSATPAATTSAPATGRCSGAAASGAAARPSTPFCPLGPALVTTDEIRNPNALRIRTVVNGETLQDWNTSDMIFDVPALISFLSGSSTLEPGTVIMTGTPHGVGSARTTAPLPAARRRGNRGDREHRLPHQPRRRRAVSRTSRCRDAVGGGRLGRAMKYPGGLDQVRQGVRGELPGAARRMRSIVSYKASMLSC